MLKFFGLTVPQVVILLIVTILSGCKSSNSTLTVGSNEDVASTQAISNQANNDQFLVQPENEAMIYQATNSRIWDLLHTKLELSFDWDNQVVNGLAQLELTPYFYPQATINFLGGIEIEL